MNTETNTADSGNTESSSTTAATGENPLARIRVVMVNTKQPANIGAAARAMKNMGISQLYLVEPRDFPNEKATARASNAVDVLESAVIVDSLDEAIADCGLVIGTSARERRIPWPLLDPRHCCAQAYAEASQHDVALVFGREDRGLTNEELQRCNMHVHIPANPEYSSLNIAMAIQLLCYEVRMCHLQGELSSDVMADWDMPPAKADALENFFIHLEESLVDMQFLNPAAPKQLMTRLRRLFHRSRMDQMEVSILRGVLTSAQQWVAKAKDNDTTKSINADEAAGSSADADGSGD